MMKTLGTSGASVRYTWDNRGRLIQVADYSNLAFAEGQQHATEVIQYTYDYLNRRIRETVTVGGTTSYDYLVYQDGGGMPWLEITASGGLAATNSNNLPIVTDRYLNAESVDLVLADDQTNPSSNRVDQTPDTNFGPVWLLTDQVGTARDLVYYSATAGSWLVTHRVFNSFGARAERDHDRFGRRGGGHVDRLRRGAVGPEHRAARLVEPLVQSGRRAVHQSGPGRPCRGHESVRLLRRHSADRDRPDRSLRAGDHV